MFSEDNENTTYDEEAIRASFCERNQIQPQEVEIIFLREEINLQ